MQNSYSPLLDRNEFYCILVFHLTRIYEKLIFTQKWRMWVLHSDVSFVMIIFFKHTDRLLKCNITLTRHNFEEWNVCLHMNSLYFHPSLFNVYSPPVLLCIILTAEITRCSCGKVRKNYSFFVTFWALYPLPFSLWCLIVYLLHLTCKKHSVVQLYKGETLSLSLHATSRRPWGRKWPRVFIYKSKLPGNDPAREKWIAEVVHIETRSREFFCLSPLLIKEENNNRDTSIVCMPEKKINSARAIRNSILSHKTWILHSLCRVSADTDVRSSHISCYFYFHQRNCSLHVIPDDSCISSCVPLYYLFFVFLIVCLSPSVSCNLSSR